MVTLSINKEQWEKYGFENLELQLILREIDNSLIKITNGDPIKLPKKLSHFLPLGNPPSFFVGYNNDDETNYLSIFHANNFAIHFLAKSTHVKTHPIFFIRETYRAMRDLLYSLNTMENKQENIYFTLSAPLQIEYLLLKNFKGLDTFLYNLLIQKNMVIIGKTDDLLALFEAIISLLPEHIQSNYSFTINLFDPTVKLIGIDPEIYENYQEKIEELLHNNFDLVTIKSTEAFGEYTTPLTEYLINIPKTAQDIPLLQHAIKKLYEIAKTFNETEINNINFEFTNYSLTPSDKKFMTQIKEVITK